MRKMHETIWQNGIEKAYQEIEAEGEAGFRVGRSKVYHITIKQIIKKRSATNRSNCCEPEKSRR